MTSAQSGQDSPTLYTAAEAAEILRVKKSWLERQAASRKIPFTVLGGSYKFTPAHLAAIVRMHEQLPAPRIELGARGARPRHATGAPQVITGRSEPLRPRPRPRGSPRRAA